jgi:hypothetical protein
MTRPLSEYSPADWRRLRPLTHAIKTLRYRAVDRLYRRRPARAGDPQALARAIAGRQLLTTIAFADPEAIDWQGRLLGHYLPRPLHLIADNSPDDASAEAIAAVARNRRLAYIRLPQNPWRDASRSHGIALNWVWHNVVRRGRPAAFGFLDDDLFPTGPDDPFAPLESQDFYGVVREWGPRWFLWAGYCSFRFDRVADKPLDFGQDWFKGLDTGGGNWRVLYRHVERARLREAESRYVPFKAGVEMREGPLQWCGSWLHEIGAMGRSDLRAEKRRAVAEILAPHLAAACGRRLAEAEPDRQPQQ